MVYRLISVLIGILAAGLLATGLPVYDILVEQAALRGGLLSMVFFWSVLLACGFVLLLFAIYVWRKQ